MGSTSISLGLLLLLLLLRAEMAGAKPEADWQCAERCVECRRFAVLVSCVFFDCDGKCYASTFGGTKATPKKQQTLGIAVAVVHRVSMR